MTGVQKAQPAIRFEGFSGDWVEKTLQDIAKVFDGTHQTPNYTDKGVKFLSVENIKDLKSNKYISVEDFERDFKNYPEFGDVLMTRIGDIGTSNVFRLSYPVAYYVTLALLKPFAVSSNYLNYAIASNFVQSDIWKRTLHIAFPKKINMNEIKKVSILLPTLESEQTAIGNFFQQLDDSLALHKRKHQQTQQLKKAMLSKLFPQKGQSQPEIRLQGFSGDWEEKRLGDLGEYNPNSVLPKQFNYVDLESVVGTKLMAFRKEELRAAPSRAQRLARNGDLFFQAVRPYQKNNYLFRLQSLDFVFSTGYIQIRPFGNADFLLASIQKDEFIIKVLQNCTGTSYPAISTNDFKKLNIFMPTNPKEQAAIGNFFKQLDDTLALQAEQIATLENLKTAFLQKLFV